ncbi:hypothetical protein KQI65_06980 [bacterium]|nr:hypothetical protein [bacterium]
MIRIIVVSLLLCASLGAASAQTGLRDPSISADGILIVPDAFAQDVAPLVEYRGTQGIRYEVATIGAILQAFPAADTLTSIREFTTYAMHSWTPPAPVALLLVGDVEWVPTYMLPPHPAHSTLFTDTVAIDDMLADDLYDDDALPELAVGRLPAASIEEVRTMVAKTIAYEKLSPGQGSLDQLGLADYEEGDPFLSMVHTWQNSFDPDRDRSVALAANTENAETIIDSLAHHISHGIGTLLYAGHGAPDHWSALHLVDATDIPTLELGTQPFFLYTVACSQRFDLDSAQSVPENMLRVKDGGAVGAIVSSGLAFGMALFNIGMEARSYMEENKDACYGLALLEVKLRRGGGPGDSIPPLSTRSTLLGDPFLHNPHWVTGIQTPSHAVSSAVDFDLFPNPLPNGTRQLSLDLKNPASGTGTILLRNLLGQTVLQRQLEFRGQRQRIQLTLPALRPGYYQVSVLQSGQIKSHGIVVQ